MKRVWAQTTIFALLLSATAMAGGKSASSVSSPIPPAPKYYVLDEAKLLTPLQKQALSALLIEHDHAAGERIYIGIFENAGKQKPDSRTSDIFDQWQGGRNENGIVLAYFKNDDEGALQYGVGFDGRLSDAKASKVVSDFLIPEIRANHPYRALSSSALEILRSINSPLIESGRAEELVRSGGVDGALSGTRGDSASGTWWVWLVLGLIPMLMVLHNILAAEAHFTGTGWFRSNPLKLISLKDLRASASATRSRAAVTLGGADGQW